MCAQEPKHIISALRFLGDDGNYNWIETKCIDDLFVYLKSTNNSNDCSDMSPHFFRFVFLNSDIKIEHPVTIGVDENILFIFACQDCFVYDPRFRNEMLLSEFEDMFFEFQEKNGIKPVKCATSYPESLQDLGCEIHNGYLNGVRLNDTKAVT